MKEGVKPWIAWRWDQDTEDLECVAEILESYYEANGGRVHQEGGWVIR